MRLNNKILLNGIFALGISAGASVVSSAEALRNVASTEGVQFTFNYSAPDHLLILGRIEVNLNKVKNPDLAIPLLMSMPAANLDNHRLWEPFRHELGLEPDFSQPAMYYPFDTFNRPQETPFGHFNYMDPFNFYASPGEAKNLPPLDAPLKTYFPGATVFIENLSLGIETRAILPEGSVKKVAKNRYHVNFDTCELGIAGDQCGVIDFTIKPDWVQSSTFIGTRVDAFRPGKPDNVPHVKMRYTGEFKESSASVEGSIFGTDIFPGVRSTINNYTLKNITRSF